MIRNLSILPLLGACFLTGACASFEAMPRPVPEASIRAEFRDEAVMDKLDTLTDMEAKRELRNRAVTYRLGLADDKFAAFLVALGIDVKSSNLGLDLGITGLSSLGAVVAEKSANEISAAVAALTGARGAINRELYYEKTLPAIISSINANRLRVKTDILRHLRNDNVVQYPFEQALADLKEYRVAAQLDLAITQITTESGQRAAAAVEEYRNATKSCGPSEEVGDYWGRLNDLVYGLAADGTANGPPAAGSPEEDMLADLATIVKIVGESPSATAQPATDAAGANAQAGSIMAKASEFCTKEALESLFGRITAATNRSIPQ
jgi:hypothetical protein